MKISMSHCFSPIEISVLQTVFSRLMLTPRLTFLLIEFYLINKKPHQAFFRDIEIILISFYVQPHTFL